ncbi:MAG: pseudaminic acid synthase [Gammaproteobacteria bacterium]|nr:pseudaminic acid synthase [Gammaproteobacteria bacterium]
MIAELSGNHGGRLRNALAMIDAAAEAGADLIKLQTYRPDTITLDQEGPAFQIDSGLWRGRTLYELYQQAHTPWDWHAALFEHARARGVPLFSSPFDPSAVDLLESLGCPAYKIASFELVDLALIRCVAATGKPVILSTGMATRTEVEEALAVVREYPQTPVALLHCTSGYPTPVDEADLRSIPAMMERHRTVVGLSDHTAGSTVAIAAVALGASLVEKHFTLDREDGAVDAAFSLLPSEFRAMSVACLEASRALGQVREGPAPSERSQLRFRRSLFAAAEIPAGSRVRAEQVASFRPATGLPPRDLERVIGRVARVAIARGTPLNWDLLE